MRKFLLSAVCAALLFTGVAMAQIAIRIGPPPPRREVVPVRPVGHPDWVWQQGYQRWDGRQYVWVPGTYVAPPYRGARWVPGHWRNGGRRGWVWVPGHWRRRR